ncbi:3-ketosteroid-delta-1-dehydrogenase [Rhodococcus rhodnii]|uniref:3-oxosteroid 1-dehydrogenase n=2 Tax=Rhodococcus rhodnii TaxID=38312 RepID=R7WWN9_9NOCA|nr:3-ketosteroid-delta-1-dehydrogenase [Rhodococcus rhodnii]EOM78559.1 3-ketosteroid-delta-1-dehydrogenase [Rhodococcus rhodnii LMG 5362]TXG91345.1 3-ketosteroid-delta-1-dehydrogenase [Rhodococcus rhodnii]
MSTTASPDTTAADTTVDVVVIGSGTGLAAALAAHEKGLDVLVVEKTEYVGGSTARSGGAFWIPANPVLQADVPEDTRAIAATYLDAVVGESAPKERRAAYLDNGAEAVAMIERTTPLEFFWAKGYSDYHPEKPGGSAVGRTCESTPFDLAQLGEERARFRPGLMASSLPMPVTGADYKWLNLVMRTPAKSLPRAIKALAKGLGGKLRGREYTAGGQALAAGLFAGVIRAGIPVWTETSLTDLVEEDGRITGAVLRRGGVDVTVAARKGVVLAAGGFDHDMAMRHKYQSESLGDNESLGAEGNTGDAIVLGERYGAAVAGMDRSWWFPAVAPVPGGAPSVLLAERALPGSLVVDSSGSRFVNEASDYMSFGQKILAREQAGDPVGSMWLVFDQRYRDSYILAGGLFPRQPLPKSWYANGIAHRADDAASLARSMGVSEKTFTETLARFDAQAAAGVDHDFDRGGSAYDRYYGDPTIGPNPNLRPLSGQLYAVKMVLSDLGTCGGLVADDRARVLREDGSAIAGLYAIGNTAANAFGDKYPGAGATIGQGLVYGYIAAQDLARQDLGVPSGG